MGRGDTAVTHRGDAQKLTSAPSTTCRHHFPTVRFDAHGTWPLPRARRTQTEADGAVHPHDHPPPSRAVAGPRRGARRRRDRRSSRPPPPARHRAPPPRPASWSRKAAEQLTAIDEQVHEAELTVAAQQQAAAAAAARRRRRAGRAGRLRAAAAGDRPERLHRQDPVPVRRLPHQRVGRRARPADDDAGHDRRRTRTPSSPRSPPRRTPPQQAQAAADQAAATADGRPRAARRRSRPRSRSRSPPTRPTSPGCRPPSRPPSPPPSPGRALQAPSRTSRCPPARAGEAIATALAQVGDPYEHGASGPDAFDCSGLTSYAYAAAGHLAAALQPGAVPARHPGVAGRAAARRPGLLLLADQPRGPLHRQRDDGARPHLRLAGRRHQRRPARLPVRRPPRLTLVGSVRCRRPSASICTRAAIRFARVAAVAAVCTRQRTA